MRYLVGLVILLTCASAHGAAIYSGGIRSAGLHLPNGDPLTGANVGIGQVESGRAGKPNFDINPLDHNDAVKPDKVFANQGQAQPGGAQIQIGNGHATRVAGVMIGDPDVDLPSPIPGEGYAGVSPGAKLSSSASAPESISAPNLSIMQAAAVMLVNQVPQVRATNMSFVVDPPGDPATDGNFELTQFVDWSARQHNVLYVAGMAATYVSTGAMFPSDNFNGITVGASAQGEVGDNYYIASSVNRTDEEHDAAGDRVSLDLLAPGDGLVTLGLNNLVGISGESVSFATPHVTGAVALLHEYGEYQVQNAGWNGNNAHRHEVMKAVLLNSADKLQGYHGSTRTVKSQNETYDWTNRPGGGDSGRPLDMEIGAGHLNVNTALKQYRSQEWEPGIVPNIGWDYSSIAAFDSHVYALNRPLFAGEVIAVTLCWDRRVETISPNSNSYLDGFFPYVNLSEVLADLDIWIQPFGADPNNLGEVVWGSDSGVDNVEHVFFPVNNAGNYQIVIRNTEYGLIDLQNYGLAWWVGESIPGDFDGDGDVDNDDLPKWKTSVGTSEADADYDGDSDGNDFLAWQRNLGFGPSALPAVKPVPEPSSLSLCALGLPLLWLRRRFAALCAGAAIVGIAQPASAATVVFARESRPVSVEEIADGAPSGALVSNFYATADADILSVVTSFHLPVFKHRAADDHSPVDTELAAMFPGLRASSYLDTPGDTLRLGGGWTSEGEKVWGDLSNDGPQKDFLFGRLTTSEAGTFSGFLAMRGEWTYVNVPFSFDLPGDKGAMTETFTVFKDEPKPPVFDSPPVEALEVSIPPTPPMFPQIIPTFSMGMSAEELRASFLASLERKRGRLSESGFAATQPLVPSYKGWLPLPLPKSQGERTDVASVPEPSAWVLCSLGAIWAGRSLRPRAAFAARRR
jgi:hypothetical protein